MALKSTLVMTHVNGSDKVIILSEGKEFMIISGAEHTKKFSASDAAAIVKAVTSFDTNVKIAKLNAGRSLLNKDRHISILCEDSSIEDEPSYQILDTIISTKITDVWPLNVITEDSLIELPLGVLDDLLKTLAAEGVDPAASFGTYDKIEFVDALPTENIEENVAYVLNKADGDKARDTGWLYVEEEWTEITDDEAEADEGNGEEETPPPNPEPVVEGGGEGGTGFEPGPEIPTP